MKSKVLLMIADGLGDRPCEVLGYKTPLEAAVKPNLNAIAAQGVSGIMDLHECGTPVGTDLGHMILFGYALSDYPGRGPMEAFGEGIELQSGDVAFRANFATMEEGIIIDRRAGRIREGTKELAKAIHGCWVEDVQVLFKEATEHRAVLVLRGPGLSEAVNDSDPKKEGIPYREVKALDESDEAAKTARIMNRVLQICAELLEGHEVNIRRKERGLLPANFILTRGAGLMPALEKMTEAFGFTGACVAAESTVLGAAKLAGFDVITDPKMTGNMDTDVELKAKLAIEALKTYDFVCLHLKAPDLMGHDNNPVGKKKAIELFDTMVGHVMKRLSEEEYSRVIVALAADHSTPCERREHSGEPVPVVIMGQPIRKDDVTEYDEIKAAKGGLNRLTGRMFNRLLLDYLEVTPKRGN